MASLLAAQITQVYADGDCEKFSLLAIKNVTTGDTVDLSPYFRAILQTTWMGATVSGVANGTWSGTTATAPAGLSSAGAYLLVQGVSV